MGGGRSVSNEEGIIYRGPKSEFSKTISDFCKILGKQSSFYLYPSLFTRPHGAIRGEGLSPCCLFAGINDYYYEASV